MLSLKADKTNTQINGLSFSIAGNVAHTGAFSQTLKATGTTDVTLPTTGTLATLAGTETLSSKTFVAPVLGAATASSVNKVVFTQPTNSATLTLADGTTLSTAANVTHAGAFSQILRATAATDVTLPTTGTLATRDGIETLQNKTFVAPALGTPASGVLTNCTGTAAGLTAGSATTATGITFTNQAPATNTAGTKGNILFDEDNLYICVATGSWKKVSLATIL